ncbi:MAG: type II toxin-antitoxin system PemK/MazF family toxin [bacterium]|nr:type II toxin-antitoxin system PemK/MazF family toxin [Candidatus Limimorpha caballi]
MRYEQRDIVEISFLFPDGNFKPHPALIVSNNELQLDEGFIYLALISSKSYNPQYCYELDDEMLTSPLQKKSYVKCRIIVGNIERDVIRKISRVRKEYFDEIVEKIKSSIF